MSGLSDFTPVNAQMDISSCSDIEPSLARKVALGDVDPTTFVPMEDINPAYVPRVVKSLQLVSNAINRYKNDEPPKRGSLLNFFGTFFWFNLPLHR